MIDLKIKELFIELRSQGKSFDKIAVELKVSKPTLIKWARELYTEIQNLKAERKDAILEECQIRSENRLKVLAQSFNRLEIELNKRDLSDIPTYKLLDQIGKLNEQINQVETGLEFKEDKLSFIASKWPI